MQKLYHAFYYHIVKSFELLSNESTNEATGSALSVLTFVQIMNLLSVIVLLDILGVKLLTFLMATGYQIVFYIMCAIVFFVSNHIYFKIRRVGIIYEMSLKSTKARKRGALLTLIYGILSIVFVMTLARIRGVMLGIV